MRVRLEDELARGMRERTAGLRPAPDLVARAARGHRRRRRGRLAVGGAGGLAVAAVTVAALGAGAGPTPSPPPVAGGSAASSPARAPQMLTVAQVSQRAVAALDAGEVRHSTGTLTVDGRTQRTETWYDPVTGAFRQRQLQTLRGEARHEVWIVPGPGHATVTVLDLDARTWYQDRREPVPARKLAAVTGEDPDDLRAALRRGELRLIGPETVDGAELIRLRADYEGASEELWVDADTYRPVRRVTLSERPGPGEVTRVEVAYRWSPRAAEALAPLEVTIPAGFVRVDPPPADPNG
jgi:hypothetical protein